MARSNGAYTRPSNSFSNPVAGTTISPVDADSLFDDIETALDVIAIRDDKFSILDNSDPTKVVAIQVSGVTTGTTRTLTVPDANTTIVGTDATQTLTNKTINGASNTITLADNNVSDAKLRDSGALSVIGRAANSSGDPADISAAAGGYGVLRENGNSISFGPVLVPHGGIGATSLTAYAVICGGTTATGNVQSIASVGTSGQVLTSNGAGALPTMQNRAAVSSKVGAFSRDLSAASGNVAYTGVGFQPSALIFVFKSDGGYFGEGFADSSGAENCIFSFGTSAPLANTADDSNILFFPTVEAALTNYQNASVSSFDADGFTLAYTKTGTPTGTGLVRYIAFR